MIVKSHLNKVFGGYTDIPQRRGAGRRSGNGNSFIFSIRPDSTIVKLKCLKKEFEMAHENSTFFQFGGSGTSYVLAIKNDCNTNNNSYYDPGYDG